LDRVRDELDAAIFAITSEGISLEDKKTMEVQSEFEERSVAVRKSAELAQESEWGA